MWRSGSPSNTWFPGTNRVKIPNGTRTGSATFAGQLQLSRRPNTNEGNSKSPFADAVCLISISLVFDVSKASMFSYWRKWFITSADVLCKNIKCSRTTNGRRNCIVKKWFTAGCAAANLPHSRSTRFFLHTQLLKPSLHDTTYCQTGLTTNCIMYTTIQPVVKPVWQPAASYSNHQCLLIPHLHDKTGCTTSLTTGRTNSGCSFNTVERTLAVRSTRLSSWLYNRFYRVNGV